MVKHLSSGTVFHFLLFFCVKSVLGAHHEVGRPVQNLLQDILQIQGDSRLKLNRRQLNFDGPPDSWTGKWFPEKASFGPCPYLFSEGKSAHNSMWKMINSSCDDGKTNLTVDWSGSPVNYTCFNPHRFFLPNYDLPNIVIKSLVPKAYRARHECMQKEIHYSRDLPTFGTHRAAWPRYGEYKFVPRQRWLHSLEHGAIVLLYHPCAHPELVNELRVILTGCLFRHVITPYTLLSPERPFALVSWGWAFLMTAPDEAEVIEFIRNHALRGPEPVSTDGQFSEGLIEPAKIVSDPQDSAICPNHLFNS